MTEASVHNIFTGVRRKDPTFVEEDSLAKPFFDTDKFASDPVSPTVFAFHKAIKDRIRAHMEAGGQLDRLRRQHAAR